MPQVIKLSNYLQTESFDDQLKSISQNLDLLSKKFIEVIENVKRTNTELSTQTATQSQTNKAISETNKNLDILAKAEKETNQLREQSTKLIAKARAERTEEGKTLIKVKQARQEQNRKIADEIKLNKSAEGSYNQLNQKLKIAISNYQKLGKAEREGATGKAMLKNIQGLDKQLKGFDVTVGKHQRNVGNYQSALEGLPGPLGRASSGVGNLVKSFAKLLLNPIVLLIAAVVAAVYAIGKAFLSTDAGATFFSAKMEQVSAATSVFKQRLADVVPVLGKLFKSDWFKKETWQDLGKNMKEVFTGTIDQFKEATKAAQDYIYALDALNDAEIDYISQKSKNKNLIAQFEFGAQDRTKSTEERRKMLKEAIMLSEEETKKAKEFADRKYDIELTNTAARFNINKNLLKKYIEADDQTAQILLKNNADLAAARNKMNDEGQQKLEEFYAAAIDADTKFYEENKRNISRLSGFEEEIRKEEEEKEKELRDKREKGEAELLKNLEKLNQDKANTEKERAAARLKIMEDNFTREINAEKEKYIAGSITLEEYEKRNLEITTNYLLKQLELSTLTADQRLTVETKLLDMKIGLMKTEADAQAEADKEKIEKAKKTQETLMDIAKMGFDTATMYIDMQESNLEMMYDYEIERAGDNEALKERIDKKYDGERKKLQRQQAIAKKAEGIFSAIINTAQGVTKALDLGPIGIPLAVIIGILGAAQIGIIASQDIPKFEKGSKGLPVPMLAEYGEKGREIVQEPGKIPYLAEQSTISYLPKGTKIIPNYETERILAGAGGVTDAKFNELIREERKTRQELKARPVNQTNITRDGFEYLTRTGYNTIKWNNKYFP